MQFTTENGNVASIDTLAAANTVHDYLFGSQSHRLTAEAQVEVYLSCDGFGDTSRPGELRDQIRDYMNGGWDWSHVRDSSPQGFSRALAKILELQS